MRYEPEYMAKELRSLADKLDKYDEGLSWGALILMLDTADKDLADKQANKIQ